MYGFTRANNGGVPENFACYFVMAFDQPFSCAGLSADSLLHQDQQELAADQVFAFLRFAPGKSVTVRIATSFISLEQAEQNLPHRGRPPSPPEPVPQPLGEGTAAHRDPGRYNRSAGHFLYRVVSCSALSAHLVRVRRPGAHASFQSL